MFCNRKYVEMLHLNKLSLNFLPLFALLILSGICCNDLQAASKKKIVFIAGAKSHGYGSHEHQAGCMLLADALNKSGLPVQAEVYTNGWPKDPTVLNDAAAIVIYCDGGGRHPVHQHLDEVDKLAKKGIGIGCIHYAVEIGKGKPGNKLLDWIGGYFEANWSVNPHWNGHFRKLPKHAVARGVKPFTINDEWYYHMRFTEQMQGVTPILSDLPPQSSLRRKDGPHSGNPDVRAAVKRKESQHTSWVKERADGGRGFGFTGGHYHWNWGHDQFRKLVLNEIVWIAKVDVPKQGVPSKSLTVKDLEANQDYPKSNRYNPHRIQKLLDEWNQKTLSKTSTQKITVEKKDDHPPKSALKGLQVGKGLSATLFASEPQLLSPTNIDVDARGRVWVCECVNYRRRQGERPAGDRILILEDTNGDGVADSKKVFYQGNDVNSALGICVLGNRVIVSCAPNVLVFTDENGDDVPDKKELLFTKSGQPQHDHSLHAFVFGPDGKLYWNFGNTGKVVNDKLGKQVVDVNGIPVIDARKPYIGGMAFRCDLDGSNFEVLAHNFRNNYELAVDSFGTVWQSDNDDDGNRAVRINYVMRHGNFGYKDELTGAGWRTTRTGMKKEIPLRHWHLNDPGVVPNLLQTGAGSPTGICFYEGTLLPAQYQNAIIHADAGPNIVRAYPVKNSGAGYSATIEPILEGVKDKWFRPSDVCVAPDGSIFIADWYDPGVGGHGMGDTKRGRIFRIAPPGKKYHVPKYDFKTAKGSAEALKNPAVSVRAIAWMTFAKMGAEAEPALQELLKSKNTHHQARALWLLTNIAGKSDEYVQHAIKDNNSSIRITGLRMAERYKVDLVKTIKQLVHDSSPQVRRECAVMLKDVQSNELPKLWAKLASQYDGKDRWYLEALGIGASMNWDACLNAWLSQVGNQWNSASGRDIIWRSRAKVTPRYLAKILIDSNRTAEESLRYFRAFDFLDSANTQAALKQIIFDKHSGKNKREIIYATEALTRLNGININKHSEYRDVVNKVLDSSRGTTLFLQMITKFQVQNRYDDVLKIAVTNSNSTLGVNATLLLLNRKQQQLLESSINNKDAKIALNSIKVLGTTADNRAVPLLLQVLTNNKKELAQRQAAIIALGKSRKGAIKLITMSEKKQIDDSLTASVAATLHSVRWQDVKKRTVKIFPLPATKNKEPLPPIADLIKMRGNASKGKIVFNTTGTCAKCHQVNGVGKQIGPDLSEIGKKLSRLAMIQSILFPSASISHNYETYAVVLENGTQVSGVLVSQTDEMVTIKTAEAIVRTIPRSEIDEIVKKSVSMMPADLQKVMTVDDLKNVIEYLTTLKKAKKKAGK